MPRCVVPGCNERHTSTHFFPKDPKRREQWVKFVKGIDPDFTEPGVYSSVCGAHFETKCYNFSLWLDQHGKDIGHKNPRRTLSEEAVPTIVGVDSGPSRSSSRKRGSQKAATSTKNGPVFTNTFTMIQSTSPVTTVSQSEAPVTQTKTATNVKKTVAPKISVLRSIASKPVTVTLPQQIMVPTGVGRAITTPITTSKTVPSLLKIATNPALMKNAQGQKVIMLKNGSRVKVLGNFMTKTDKGLVSTNLSGSSTPLATTSSHNATPPVQPPVTQKPKALRKKLYTVDELNRLSRDEFLAQFTAPVKILDSFNHALRCQLIRSCPFVISCPLKMDCERVMFLHLKKHLSNLQATQAANKVPYKISTGVKLKENSSSSPSAAVKNPQNVTQQNSIGVRKVEIASSGATLNSTAGGIRFVTSQATKPVVKVMSSRHVQILPNTATVSQAQGCIQSTSAGPVILNHSPAQWAKRQVKMPNNGQPMVMKIAGNSKTTQANGSAAPGQNMTLLLMPVTGVGSKSHTTGPQATQQQLKVVPTVLRPKNPQILHKGPISTTNEMILKAKEIMDKKVAHKSRKQVLPRFNRQRDTLSPPPFEVKITPPRLIDLAKHVISGDSLLREIDLAGLLARSKPPEINPERTAKKPENVFCKLTAEELAKKNSFLRLLGLQGVDSKRDFVKRKMRETRTRLQRRKMRNEYLRSRVETQNAENEVFDPESDRKRPVVQVSDQDGPDLKRVKVECDPKPALKFKQIKKHSTFEYDFLCHKNKKRGGPGCRNTRVEEMLPECLVVLKRVSGGLPKRVDSKRDRGGRRYKEVVVNGEVVRIKQEMLSDGENESEDESMKEKMLQPPSDDETDDILCNNKYKRTDDGDTTDSDSEFCAANKWRKKYQERISDRFQVSAAVKKGRIGVFRELEEKYLALKYIERLTELMDFRRAAWAAGGYVPVPPDYMVCKICYKKFTLVDTMLAHYRRHAGGIWKEVQENIEKECLLSSGKAPSKLDSRKRTFPFQNRNFTDKPFQCELCHMRFFTCRCFEQHLIEEHSDTLEAQTQVVLNRLTLATMNSKSDLISEPILRDRGQECAAISDDESVKDALPIATVSDSQVITVPDQGPSTPDRLESSSPPLPHSPGMYLRDPDQIQRDTVNVLPPLPADRADNMQNRAEKSISPDPSSMLIDDCLPSVSSDMSSIKLTLFPKNGSGLSRICFSNGGKLLGS